MFKFSQYVVNMAFNLLFCGIIVWRIFLVDAEGNRDTTIQANYARMGFWFGLTILVLVLITVFSTRTYRNDTRHESAHIGQGLGGFIRDMTDIFKDLNSTFVFLFFCVVSLWKRLSHAMLGKIHVNPESRSRLIAT